MFNMLNSSKKSLSLIEVLVASAILAILATAILYSLQKVTQSFKICNDYTRSIYLAELILSEEIKNPDYTDKAGSFDSPYQQFNWSLKYGEWDKFNQRYPVEVEIRDKINKRLYAKLFVFVKEK